MNYIATITYKNQLTLPQKIVDLAGLAKTRKVLISALNKTLIIKPLDSRVESLAGSLNYLTGNKASDLIKVRSKTKQIVAQQIAREGI